MNEYRIHVSQVRCEKYRRKIKDANKNLRRMAEDKEAHSAS